MADDPMRILAFVPALGGGGAEKHVERMANAMPPALATMDVAVVRRGGRYERFLAPHVRVHELRPRALGSALVETLAGVPALRRLLREQRYDAVIAFLDRPSLAAWAATRSLPRGVRPALLLSVQNDPDAVFDEDPLGPLFRASMRHLFADADEVIAISEGVAARVRSVAPSLDPHVIPNACVDHALRAQIASAERPRDGRTIVACGRLGPQKGFDVLLDAFAVVRTSRPEAKLRLLGEGTLDAALRERAHRLGLADAVEFAGFVDRPAKAFAEADVFCLSSRYEGLGMVVVEAMAAGTPVVSTDCPYGPSEILEGGALGRLVAVDDRAGIARALLELLGAPEERARLAALGRRRAEDYDAEVVAVRHAERVRRLLEARRAAASKPR